jgi:hypothetical protein
MTIMQRGPVDGVLCDVACTGRFYDFLEKRDGRWGMVLRQPIYEKCRAPLLTGWIRIPLSRPTQGGGPILASAVAQAALSPAGEKKRSG